MAEHEHKVEIIGEGKTCLTFAIRGEDHTMGNALRYVLMKNEDVEFCGYSIPHPSEDMLHIRLQTREDKDAVDVFRTAIRDLRTMTKIINSKFDEAQQACPRTITDAQAGNTPER